jgi:uncharacterized protein (DUF1501 family)
VSFVWTFCGAQGRFVGATAGGIGCPRCDRLAWVQYVGDHHKNIFPTLANDFLPELDRAFSTLLEDLDQRGMLDSTLVIVTGEFGRTLEINAMDGRDHWPNAFSMAMAGGGITGGRVLGETDDKGMFVKDHPVEVPDLVATIYSKLGIDHNEEYMSNGRPIKLSQGKPFEFLMS